ncbi:hypothetical protein BC834DRAFT_1453 [Gloeopeniophorella convolvens]|nr:hypothetical protein BC834DRAFT_1453 [Gloeopeniophorella convolvens]
MSIFPSGLSLSDGAAVDALLADIPVFSIGLLGFGAMSLLVVLKKVNATYFFLFSSILFTFFAAISDLTQILVRRRSRGGGDITNEGLVRSLIITRETLYSIATGLRFFFFWTFVAQPPRCEQASVANSQKHSGKWSRWGMIGLMLQWTTLIASLSVLVLQFLWRIIQSLHRFGPVYDVDNAIEIASSGIFVVKLLLNILIADAPSRWLPFYHYLAAFMVLLINMGIGVGNMISFAFSESTLGRFLLAVELYVITVSVLISLFYPHNQSGNVAGSSHAKRASSFRGLHVSYYDDGLGSLNRSGADNADPRQSRPLPGRRLSSWLGWGAPASLSTRSESTPEDEKRWRSEEDTERGISPPLGEEEITTTISYPEKILGDTEQIARWQDRVSASPRLDSPTTSSLARRDEKPPIPARRQLSDGLVYEFTQPISSAAPTVTSHSRIGSGLRAEVVAKRESAYSLGAFGPLGDDHVASSRSSGFETLLREQNELEKSIATLRVFAARQDPDRGQDTSGAPISDLLGQSRTRESVGAGNVSTSASGRSEFSLSIFPVPPRTRRSGEASISNRRSSTSGLIPLRLPVTVREEQRSGSPANLRPRADSDVSHYDVTSFIGGPSSSRQKAGLALKR